MSTLIGCFWQKYVMFKVKKTTNELCLVALKIDAEFERKVT